MEPRGFELITRYKRNYRIPAEAEITEQMILEHWDLERKLTQKLLESNSENRWEIFEQAYTTLYSKLEWQNSFVRDSAPTIERYETWLEIIGSPPKKIYEIGSGKGEMIAYLAKCGFECKATEITRERGSKHVTDTSLNLSWGNSDGVHLDNFEQPEFYDVVVSNQVIEHFHPDDLTTHFKSAYKILVNQGKYIFTTPHCHTGPHDVSFVFGYDNPQGMHLKEYTYKELHNSLKIAGYKGIYCAVPAKLRKLLSILGIKKEETIIFIGILYLNIMFIVENILFVIPSKNLRRFFSRLLRKVYLFADNIFLVAQK
ncbi:MULTISPECIES: class I SAM-dependent methyltransferase [unclassified Nostoc]|uniref:class I SAM-dependent methyltransferase n=1 Tax=unclassified Nostoc TaxID=2593658 RepID=UPI002AD431F1|nr:class I SAM-dependent methyltransferase [Nostoc sp. DedQUE03]MDZ7973996.1 class I SAM-dependent methyltransferase [Nostoc sp. DedQUE03]MDZ8045778.1 class I SAM-dependent methyltransferase [Nostoc sp. DedQUE02]